MNQFTLTALSIIYRFILKPIWYPGDPIHLFLSIISTEIIDSCQYCKISNSDGVRYAFHWLTLVDRYILLFRRNGFGFFSNKDILSSPFPSKSKHVISNVFLSMDRIAKEKKKVK